jgi:hypothetical protein
MFDPTIARFTSEDPMGFDAGDPNLYRYTGNDPTNATDPSGMAELAPAPREASQVMITGSTDKPVDRLRIAKYWNSLIRDPNSTTNNYAFNLRDDSRPDFIERNPDRFYIKIHDPANWAAGTPVVTAQLDVTGRASKLQYSSSLIPLVRLPNEPGWFKSDSQLLISLKYDNNYSNDITGPGPGIDDKKSYKRNGLTFPLGKRIHLAGLDAEAAVTYLGHASPPATAAIPARGVVTLNVVILRGIDRNNKNKLVPTHTIKDVEADIALAQEIYAQVGIIIKLAGPIRVEDPPEDTPSIIAVGWPASVLDDKEKLIQLNPNTRKLFDAENLKAKSGTGVINVYYVSKLELSKGAAFSWENLVAADKKYDGNIILGDLTNEFGEGRLARKHLILAHEVGHVLEDRYPWPLGVTPGDRSQVGDHFAYKGNPDSLGFQADQYNLMFSGALSDPFTTNGWLNRLRLTDYQEEQMLTRRPGFVVRLDK